MDRFFVHRILPVLLSALWPRMQRMEIRGVGRSVHTKRTFAPLPTEEDVLLRPDIMYEDASNNFFGHVATRVTRIAFSEDAPMRLRRILGDGVELVVEERALRKYEEVDDADTGIPRPYDE
jgi:hypothetical protein